MSILTRVNNIPVYTNIDEALEWSKNNRVSGYHIHKHVSVTGYMGGKKHADIPMRTVELPVKIISKPGYRPKIGSRIISTIAGKSTSTKVTANTVYDIKGFPIARDEEDFEVLPQPVSGLAQLQSGLNPLNATTPAVVNAPVINAAVADNAYVSAPVVTSVPVGGGRY